MEVYEKTQSLAALKKQAEMAGYNPATILGDGGGFSPSSPSAAMGGVSGISAGSAQTPSQVMAAKSQVQAIALENARALAEIKNIQADTKLKEANAGESGSRTDVNVQSLSNMAATLENEKIRGQILKYDAEVRRMETDVKSKTLNADMNRPYVELQQLVESLRRERRNNRIGEATESELIGRATADLILINAQAKALESQVELNEDQRVKILEEAMDISTERNYRYLSTPEAIKRYVREQSVGILGGILKMR